MAGWTNSTDFPTQNCFQNTYGGGLGDGFITQFAPGGSPLWTSSYLGGSNYDDVFSIAVDSSYYFYLTGSTKSPDFPIVNPAFQSSFGGMRDSFFVKVHPNGLPLVKATYLGGSESDEGTAIAIDTAGGVYVTGQTNSIADFPLLNPYQSFLAGGSTYDGFVTKFSFPEKHYHYDYNGDGTSDIAIFRRNTGLWAVRGITRFYFGGSSDSPVSGDYNGDGIWDGGIFRPAAGLWAIRGVTRRYFGRSSDSAVPADYNGNGRDDIGIFRYTSVLWAVSGLTRAYYGGSSDSPVTR